MTVVGAFFLVLVAATKAAEAAEGESRFPDRPWMACLAHDADQAHGRCSSPLWQSMAASEALERGLPGRRWPVSGANTGAQDAGTRSRRSTGTATAAAGTVAPEGSFNKWSASVATSATLPGDLDNRRDVEAGDGQLYASAGVVQFQAAANGSLASSALLYMVSETGKSSRSWLYQIDLASWVTLEDPIPDAMVAGMPFVPSPHSGPKRIWPSMAVAHIDHPANDDFIDTIFLFGGSTFSLQVFNDTWRLNDFRWFRVPTPGHFPELNRFRHSAAARSVVHANGRQHECQCYVFGGATRGTSYPIRFLDDVWVLRVEDCVSAHSPGHWMQLTAAAGRAAPSARAHAMLQFTGDGTLLLFGGWSENFTNVGPGQLHRDLWELDVATVPGEARWTYLGTVRDSCSLPQDKNSPSVTPPATYLAELDIVVVYTMDCSDEPIHRGQALLHIYDRALRAWSVVSPRVAYDLVPYMSLHPAPPPSVRDTSPEITFFMRRSSQDTGEFLYVPFQLNFARCQCGGNASAAAASLVSSVVVQLGTPPQYLPSYDCLHANLRTYKGNTIVFVVGGFQGNFSAGGETSVEVTRKLGMSVWLFEHAERTWSRVTPVPSPRQRGGFTVVSDDSNLYLFGGYFLDVPPTSSIPVVNMFADLWCFNFTSLEWIEALPLPNLPQRAERQRLFHSAVMDRPRARMVLFGGFDPFSNLIRSTVLLWTVLANKECSGVYHTVEDGHAPKLVGHSALVHDDVMYVFGGVTEDAAKTRSIGPSFYRLALDTLTWTDLSAAAPPGRVFANTVLYGDKILVSGGCAGQSFAHWTEQAPYQYFDNICRQYTEHNLTHLLVYDTIAALWSTFPMADSPGSLFQHTSFVFDGNVHIMGGHIITADKGSLQGAGLFNFRVSCPAGYYTGNFSSQSCVECDQFTYSEHSGATECSRCSGESMTGVLGATDIRQCSRCLPGVCHDHGDCSVTALSGVASCSCRFGFVPSDKCLLPVYYLLICFAVLLQVLMVFSIYAYRKYNSNRRAERTKARQLRISRKEVSDLASAWEISYEEVRLKKRIDVDSPGGFGEVWLAEYRDMLVAVKKLHRHLQDGNLRQEFLREVETLRRIRHPNIVLFLGTGIERATDLPFLVLEYMQRGTLFSVLSSQEIHVDHVQRLRFALDAARGMRFLHSLKPPRIHRDLKSANLLISERWVLKVADFGAARTVPNIGLALENERQPENSYPDRVQVSWPATLPRNRTESRSLLRRNTEDDPLLGSWAHLSTEVGTFAWSSPELLQRRAYGSSTDIYSFGIVLWELYTRQEPFSEFTDCRMITDLVNAIVADRRPSIGADCPIEYRSLIEQCWHSDQSKRPTFLELVPRLDNLMESWASRGVSASLQSSMAASVSPLMVSTSVSVATMPLDNVSSSV